MEWLTAWLSERLHAVEHWLMWSMVFLIPFGVCSYILDAEWPREQERLRRVVVVVSNVFGGGFALYLMGTVVWIFGGRLLTPIIDRILGRA